MSTSRGGLRVAKLWRLTHLKTVVCICCRQKLSGMHSSTSDTMPISLMPAQCWDSQSSVICCQTTPSGPKSQADSCVDSGSTRTGSFPCSQHHVDWSRMAALAKWCMAWRWWVATRNNWGFSRSCFLVGFSTAKFISWLSGCTALRWFLTAPFKRWH